MSQAAAPDQPSPWRYALPAVLGAALLVLALRGGSFDTVVRGEAFVVVWWGIALAVGFGFLPRQRAGVPVRIAIAALLLLAAWTAIGFDWTASDGRTMAELTRTLGLTGFLLVVVWSFGRESRVPGLAVVTGVMLLVCALALLSRLAPSVLTSTLADIGYERRRLSYPFNYWNALGCWAAMSVALGLAWSAHARAWWLRGGALAGVAIAATVAYLTYSRTAAVALALAPVAVVALAPNRVRALLSTVLAAAGAGVIVLVIRGHGEIAQGTGTAGAGVVAVVCVLVAAALMGAAAATARLPLERPFVPRRIGRPVAIATGIVVLVAVVLAGPRLVSDAWDSFTGAEAGVKDDPAVRLTSLGGERHLIYDAALEAFADEPLHGTGAGTFEFTWTQDPDRTEQAVDAHSIYLEALAELGLPGAILIVVALGGLLVGAARPALTDPDRRAAGAAAGGGAAMLVFCVTAGVDWMWESTSVTIAAFAAAGIAAASRPESRRSELSSLPRILIPVLALAVVALQLPVIMATNELRTSQRAANQGDEVAALSSASEAIRSEPWGATGYLQRALVLEQIGEERAAARDAREAARREPTNWRPWIILGRIEARLGNVRAALGATRRARELNPRSPLFANGQAGASVSAGIDTGRSPANPRDRP